MKSTARAALAILSLAALGFASPAAAQGRDTGIYVGLGFGTSDHSDQCSGATATITCDDSDKAFKIFGGYQFNRNFAVELGYTNLGEATATNNTNGIRITDEATAFEVVVVGMLPIASRFSVYGKLGLFSGEIDRSSNSALVATGTNDKSGLTYGAGLRFDITNNVGVRLEYQIYPDVGDITDVKVMSIGVLFKFQ